METYAAIQTMNSTAQILAECGDSEKVSVFVVFICLYMVLTFAYGLFQIHDLLNDQPSDFERKKDHEKARIVAWILVRTVAWPIFLLYWLVKWTLILIKGEMNDN